MPRSWNIGICGLMSLLLYDAVTSSTALICISGPLPQGETRCRNYTCHMYRSENGSDFCPPGYKKDRDLCIDIHECNTGVDMCGAYTQCINTFGGYYCKCDEGHRRGNQTEFCPSDVIKLNRCTDECSDNPGICGSNLICHSTPGSYRCMCDEGIGNNHNICIEVTQGSNRGQTDDKDAICAVLQTTTTILNSVCHSNSSLTTDEVKENLEVNLQKLNEILTNVSTGNSTTIGSTAKRTTTILTNVETMTLKSFVDAPRNQTINTSHLAVTMQLSLDVCTSRDMPFILVLDKNRMQVPCSLLNRKEDGAVFIVYKDLVPSQILADDGQMAIINSRVVTGTIPRNLTSSGSLVMFQLAHIQEVNPLYKTICMFWDPKKNNWSDDGCDTEYSTSNDTHTTCSCNHLSSFAILMAPSRQEGNDVPAITIITEIGLSLSVSCLLLSLLTFTLCRTLRSAHTSVLTALCSCLFLGQVLFLVGVNQTRNKVLCSVIAGGLHFFFLSAFCWMSIESFLLFMTVRNLRAVNYMTSRQSNLPVMCVLGFGVPAVIVGISAAVQRSEYGTDKYCWLNHRNTLWSFLGPVSVFIVANTTLLLFTIVLLRNRLASLNTNVSTFKNSRLLTVKALAQLFILGSTWAIGYFQFGRGSLAISYIFTICNSLQGVYIFLVHCVFSTQVRQEYRNLYYRDEKCNNPSSNDTTPHNTTHSMNLLVMSKPVMSGHYTASWTK